MHLSQYPVDDLFIKSILRKRGELRLTQTALSQKLGITRTTLANIENGNRDKINPKTFTAINKWLLENI